MKNINKMITLSALILLTNVSLAQNVIIQKNKDGKIITRIYRPLCTYPNNLTPQPYQPAPGVTVYPSPYYSCYAPYNYPGYNPQNNVPPNYYQPNNPIQDLGYGLGQLYGNTR